MSEFTEQNYRELKKEVEDAKSESERAQGALDQLMKQLKKDFGCDTLKEAKGLLEDYEAKRVRCKKKFDEVMSDYEEKWKGENRD